MISDQEAFVSITRAEICDLWPDFECHIASKNRPKLQSRPDLGGERLNINSRKSHTRSGMSGFCVENKTLKKTKTHPNTKFLSIFNGRNKYYGLFINFELGKYKPNQKNFFGLYFALVRYFVRYYFDGSKNSAGCARLHFYTTTKS